jgi:cellulose synthase/poly-beta-1,6-N-acetylglucosamine synthase-like glycosyltransferase
MMPLFFFLFFIFMVVYALLISYYHTAWTRLPEFVLPEKQASVFISVIIAARNEEKNIHSLLQSLQNQRYPKALYEVIIIDDHSSDGTWSMLQTYHSQEMQLKTLKLQDYIEEQNSIASYKKRPSRPASVQQLEAS